MNEKKLDDQFDHGSVFSPLNFTSRVLNEKKKNRKNKNKRRKKYRKNNSADE